MWFTKMKKKGITPSPKAPNQVIARFLDRNFRNFKTAYFELI